MLTMDISNLWSCLSLPELLSWGAAAGGSQRTLLSAFSGGFSHWTWLPDTVPEGALSTLRAAARRIRQTSDTLVVVAPTRPCWASGGFWSCCGAAFTMKIPPSRGSSLQAAASPAGTRWNSAISFRTGSSPSAIFPAAAPPWSRPWPAGRSGRSLRRSTARRRPGAARISSRTEANPSPAGRKRRARGCSPRRGRCAAGAPCCRRRAAAAAGGGRGAGGSPLRGGGDAAAAAARIL